MEQILRKADSPELFWEAWENCLEQTQAGPRYTRLNIEWGLEISRSRGLLVSDESFVYLNDGKPAAAVLLPIEKKDDIVRVSWVGGFVYAPIFVDRSLMKKVYAQIDGIAKTARAEKISFSIDPFFHEKINYLQKYDYLDASAINYLIDLSLPGDLLQHCRKGHRCDMKKILHDPKTSLFCLEAGDDALENHLEYMEMHHRCSGRVTRPKSTFDKQFEQLQNGEACLCGLKIDGRGAAYAYFQYRHDKAIYASGADEPDFAGLPLYHALIYTAMNHLREKGIKTVDPGQPSGPSMQFGYYPDAKQMNIALFKRGFGGEYSSNFRGTKYFTERAFNADVETFRENYAGYIREKTDKPALTNNN